MYVGGAFGVINRSFDMMYIDATIAITVDAIDVENDVNQSLRVGGFAGLVNTYNLPSQIVLKGQSITLNYDANQVQARVAAFIGLSRLVVIEGYVLNAITINDETVNATLNLTTLTSLNDFFDSEFLNEQLIGA